MGAISEIAQSGRLPPVEIRQLEHVVAVAEEGSFTRAATRCCIAQSGLSSSVRALEEELGTPLFLRTTRRVSATGAGEVFIPQARRILEDLRQAGSSVHEVGRLERGTLTLASVYTGGNWFDLARALARFRRRYPGVEIRTRTGSAEELAGLVQAGAVDAAIVGLPPELPRGTTAVRLRSAPLGVICPAGSPLAARPAVTVDELEAETLIALPQESVARQLTDLAFAATGRRLRPPLEAGDAQLALDFVGQGLGVACLPRPPHGTPGLVFVPLDPAREWTLGLLTGEAGANPAVPAFLETLPCTPLEDPVVPGRG